MNDDVGLDDLLQGGAERGDQRSRQLGDEAHRVGQDDAPAGRQVDAPHGRVERREYLVVGIDGSTGQPVEERRLAGVGVADQGDDRIRHLAPGAPVLLPHAHDIGELLADLHKALVDQPAVHFELALARAADEAEAAPLAFQVGPAPDQPASLVGQRCHLDLQHAFARRRTLAEDVEDETGAVDHLGVERLLQIALLDRRQGRVDEDERRLALGDQALQVRDLTAAEIGAGLGLAYRDDLAVDQLEIDRPDQSLGLFQATCVIAIAPPAAAQRGIDDEGLGRTGALLDELRRLQPPARPHARTASAAPTA